MRSPFDVGLNDIDEEIKIKCEIFRTYQAILTDCPSKGQKITRSGLWNCCQTELVKRLLVVSNSWDIVVQNRQNRGGIYLCALQILYTYKKKKTSPSSVVYFVSNLVPHCENLQLRNGWRMAEIWHWDHPDEIWWPERDLRWRQGS